jgi:hypothetical protein
MTGETSVSAPPTEPMVLADREITVRPNRFDISDHSRPVSVEFCGSNGSEMVNLTFAEAADLRDRLTRHLRGYAHG